MWNAIRTLQNALPGCTSQQILIPVGCALLVLLLLAVVVRSCLILRARKWREKVEAETALREAAEAANKIKADFLGYMSHQIRIPLNAIIGFTELALDTPLNPELRDYLETVRTSADWLNHVANDVLEFARIEAGSLKLEQADFSLADCVHSTVNIVRAEAEARHLGLKYKVDEKIPPLLRGDAGRLRQILFNLVENAVKYTTSGSVIVTAESVDLSLASATVRFKVADTGIGMSEGKQKDLFEPLAQGQNVDRKWKSSAFGLGISQRLVGMMGGTIEAQSMLGAGTTVQFTVAFEIARTTVPTIAISDAKANLARGLSVLVAEDGQVLAKALLESGKHSVTQAATGMEILPLFAKSSADLVLLDVDLPSVDGIETIRKIRAAERPQSHALIYALTANTSSVDRDNLRAAGADGFLSKPIDIDSFLNIAAALATFRRASATEVVSANV